MKIHKEMTKLQFTASDLYEYLITKNETFFLLYYKNLK